MSNRSRKRKETIDDPQVRLNQSPPAIKVENPFREDPEIGLLGEKNLDHNAEYSMRGLTDYLDPEIERSTLIEENFTILKDKYDIPDEYKMIVSDLEGRISKPSEDCIALYDESLRSDL